MKLKDLKDKKEDYNYPTTVYLSGENNDKINKIISALLNEGSKMSRSSIINKLIQLSEIEDIE